MSVNNAEVLLVEDEEVIAMILEHALTLHGYNVTLAGDGQVAWEILEAEPNQFETILLDREIPRMNGIELLRKLKASQNLACIPVIIKKPAGAQLRTCHVRRPLPHLSARHLARVAAADRLVLPVFRHSGATATPGLGGRNDY